MTGQSGSSAADEPVRQAFHEQAEYCDRLGSPFTGLLCRVLGEGLVGSSDIERYILHWPGDPNPLADSVPLRVAGALHALVRADRTPELAALYPPHPTPDPTALRSAARRVLREHGAFVSEFLRHAPQTNEVGRSAAIVAGWLEIAARTRLPLNVFEVGSSAGLNLIADQYAYQFGEVRWAGGSETEIAGEARPALTVTCGWEGPPPALEVPLQVRSRRGCDRHPLNMTDAAQRERLMAYVWADQRERLDRVQAAIRIQLANPVRVEACDAAEWIETVLGPQGEPNVARVVFHSIVWSYLDRVAQQRIAAHLARIGAAASVRCPLAWLRLELAGPREPAALRLMLWPGGRDELVARVHPHGAWVRWCDQASC